MGTITVTNLGKAYKQYPNRWSRLMEWVTPGKAKRHQLKWVLQGINFTVNAGEALGIIGINGAGKSTLLKLITGTTQPTTGSVHMTGRVAAMLELGMGFHPDFTGRQNALMAGQLLGISSEEIARLMPEIEAFAEIGEYIDLPVRVYSSGMQMRLAFSVATAIRPDILIVDEALSVGDTYFQHKSFERIRKFRLMGTTLLIVSHDKQAIKSICNEAIFISAGNIVIKGSPEAVMDYYNAMLPDQSNKEIRQINGFGGKIQTISGTGQAKVADIKLLDESNQSLEVVNVGQYVRLRLEVRILEKIERLVLGYGIKDRLGQVVYGTNTHFKNQQLSMLNTGDIYIYEFSFSANLGPGNYSIQTALHSEETHLNNNYEWRDLALIFQVINKEKERFDGCAWIDPKVSISRMQKN